MDLTKQGVSIILWGCDELHQASPRVAVHSGGVPHHVLGDYGEEAMKREEAEKIVRAYCHRFVEHECLELSEKVLVSLILRTYKQGVKDTNKSWMDTIKYVEIQMARSGRV